VLATDGTKRHRLTNSNTEGRARSGPQRNLGDGVAKVERRCPKENLTMNIDGVGAPMEPEAAAEKAIADIRHLSPGQLAQLGVSRLAYVKQVTANGTIAYAIHSADGTPMAIAPELDVALVAIRQHEMVPVLVH
jgi:hypothetical protein